MSSKTDKRAKEILRLLLNHGKTSVEELTELFATSPASVRRDLVRLEERGLVHRTHGGAMLAGQAVYEPFRFDASFQVREDRFAQEKRRIAAAAAELVHENETVGFTAGTTTTQVARSLRHRTGLHIITNAVNIAAELSGSSLEVILTGGTLRKNSFSLVGPVADETLRRLNADILFLGVDGFDVEHGLTTPNLLEAKVNRTMMDVARVVVVVCDSSKFGRRALSSIAPLSAIHHLITDKDVRKSDLAALKKAGIQVTVV